MKDLLTVKDLTLTEIEELFELALKLKKELKAGVEHKILAGKSLGMIFAKSSTRTRVSFEVGIYQLGGQGIFLSSNDIQLGRGETIEDTTKVLSRYVDGIMIRTFAHSDVEELAEHATIPIINGLTDDYHPCQALTDLLTIKEYKGELKGLKMTYVGDGNNMAHSLLLAAAKVGMDISIACPQNYQPDEEVVAATKEIAQDSGSMVEITSDILAASEDADVLYTDVWASMGDEDEMEERQEAFTKYQVNSEVMSVAKADAIFLHCLPAHRGEEVTAEVIDGEQSVVFDQAENRLHMQKAIMAKLMK
ncbi:ornithine carbamoyltransferase [Orenia metallireducens]|uniref:Ornithine carbamoyltransferase n=1 Tax=Orenia metallireducens TaxID=1413210 RepID=A0A285GFR8_9FIRM|nr:ornithine carbamoyltransferase [Orenia metallireducens]PRX30401.1 ornithine carbamoyltransferase [Orenia metallireducens]SNY22305.1 ornithine carbamoyltransferase [Orenia metallireducens]